MLSMNCTLWTRPIHCAKVSLGIEVNACLLALNQENKLHLAQSRQAVLRVIIQNAAVDYPHCSGGP